MDASYLARINFIDMGKTDSEYYPKINVDFRSNPMAVHLYMASLPDRLETLMKSLKSLINQVDTIQLAINYSKWDLYYYFSGGYVNPHSNVNYLYGKPFTVIEHDNSLQDGARFINAHAKPGYCLVCDDDILYPSDFVETMVKQYKKLPEPGFLTVMGKVLKPRPLQSYYKGWAKNYRTFDKVDRLQRVDIPGCCGILWNNIDILLDHRLMLIPNSDVCVGVYAHKKNIPCYVIPHAADWLKDLMPELPKDTLSIFGKYRRDDKVQTDYINRWM